ncbi:MAG: hypothetical protein JWL71_3372 [Acidobacteria bacterium]|nr:hypothetical protein [Acidobacteriota bacterium]
MIASLAAVAFIAQQPDDEWLALRNAAKGATVVVRTDKGESVQGRVVSVDQNLIVIGDPPFRSSIPRIQVCRVTSGSVGGRLSRAGLIAVVAGVGYFVGKLLAGVTDDPRNHAGGIIGGGLGALIGSAIPLRERMLYVAPGCPTT